MDENMTTTTPVEDEHRNLYEVFFDFCMEIYNFFKYIFYDIFRGE